MSRSRIAEINAILHHIFWRRIYHPGKKLFIYYNFTINKYKLWVEINPYNLDVKDVIL
jgi:hypothetical protein